MRLFLCEKPSQAKDIGKVLGVLGGRHDGYFQNGDTVVTWAFGHILTQAAPDAYGEQYADFGNISALPILPEVWQMQVPPKVSKQFKVIKGLLAKADEVVIATDADREGEVIAREILDYCGYRKKISRFWTSGLDTQSVKKALSSIMPGKDKENLYQAGLARSRADWLVGMNLSRAYTAAYSAGYGREHILSIGRIQTPTLKLVVQRDKEIDTFVPYNYYTLSVDFDSQKIHLHGNNKTEYEIGYALESNIGCFVVDSLAEVERIDRIGGQMGKRAKALLRVTPGVEAHTHEFITTGNTDSKFGLNIDNGQAREGVEAILRAENIDLIGLHFHIGSQIFGTEGSQAAIKKVFVWLKGLKEDLDFEAKILNIGGGFGIRYTDEDVSYPIEDALEEIITCLKESARSQGLAIPQLWLEPGRSIVGEAGYTLYRVGTIKEIPGIRTYVSIDGGMSDHIRTALYGAKYEVALANRMNEEDASLVTIAGKCCESGDLIAKDVRIPEAKIGDILVVACTGAYHYSMASNYNLMQRPAVVFVGDGKDKIVIKRESLEDLIKNQV